MNVLDEIDRLLDLPDTYVQILPEKPDRLIGLFEYGGVPPEHFFGSVSFAHNVQLRARDYTQDGARTLAQMAADKLSGHDEETFSLRQISNVLPLGQDQNNPPRWEFTVNFLLLRK